MKKGNRNIILIIVTMALFFSAGLNFFGGAAAEFDETIVLQPDETDGVDTYIASGTGTQDINYGEDPDFRIGRSTI